MRAAAVMFAIGCALLTGGYGAMRFAELQQQAFAQGTITFWVKATRFATEQDEQQRDEAQRRWNEAYSTYRPAADPDVYGKIYDLVTKSAGAGTTGAQPATSPPGPPPTLHRSLIVPGTMWIHAAGVGAFSIGALLFGAGLAPMLRRRMT